MGGYQQVTFVRQYIYSGSAAEPRADHHYSVQNVPGSTPTQHLQRYHDTTGNTATTTHRMVRMGYQDVAEQKQGHRDAKLAPWSLAPSKLPAGDVLDISDFPERSGHLSARELEITSTPARAIVANISQGTWTSVEATTAFCRRAALAQQLVSDDLLSDGENADDAPTRSTA